MYLTVDCQYMRLIFCSSPIDYLVHYGFESCTGHVKDVIDALRLLLYKSEIEPKDLNKFNGSEEAFFLSQEQCYPPYYQCPLADRASVALSLPDTLYTTSRLFQRALSKGKLDAESYKYRNVTSNSILHSVAGAFGCSGAIKISS